jgi:hypothetical protein
MYKDLNSVDVQYAQTGDKCEVEYVYASMLNGESKKYPGEKPFPNIYNKTYTEFAVRYLRVKREKLDIVDANVKYIDVFTNEVLTGAKINNINAEFEKEPKVYIVMDKKKAFNSKFTGEKPEVTVKTYKPQIKTWVTCFNKFIDTNKYDENGFDRSEANIEYIEKTEFTLVFKNDEDKNEMPWTINKNYEIKLNEFNFNEFYAKTVCLEKDLNKTIEELQNIVVERETAKLRKLHGNKTTKGKKQRTTVLNKQIKALEQQLAALKFELELLK